MKHYQFRNLRLCRPAHRIKAEHVMAIVAKTIKEVTRYAGPDKKLFWGKYSHKDLAGGVGQHRQGAGKGNCQAGVCRSANSWLGKLLQSW